jgi:hypothetical protein
MAEAHGHGHTPAAWTGVIIAFIGFCVGSAFTVADSPVGFWVGIGLVLLGALVGGIMRLMGLGQKYEPIEAVPAKPASGEPREHARA